MISEEKAEVDDGGYQRHARKRCSRRPNNTALGTNYDVTGLVDYETALEVLPEEPFELGLILCDGENCKREKVQFFPNGSTGKEDYRFEVEQPDFEMPAELDPPPGLRKAWLDKKLGDQAFLLLLFYRGRW